jgi:hypothetical protein
MPQAECVITMICGPDAVPITLQHSARSISWPPPGGRDPIASRTTEPISRISRELGAPV